MTAQFPFPPLHLPDQRFNCDEYSAFVRSLLQRHKFSTQLTQDIQTRIKHLEQRAHDPNFYVAFVGEFNSGKTTFINALLREELLKQSVTLRTSVPTRIQYGAKLDLAVRFIGEPSTLHFTAHNAQLQKKIRQINPQLHQAQLASMPACLHLLTTDKLVAPRVQEVTVFHQAHFLRQGIVIIDTPGINALTESHQDITRRVLTDDADLAVITIPAYEALSGNLVKFLKSDLQPFLYRSVLILTHMDTMTEQQQSQVLTNVHARLQEIAPQIPHIRVYASAAQVVLDELDPNMILPETKRPWISRFSELEKAIWKRLSAERTATSTESLLRLLDKLLEDLTTQLQEREFSYRSRQAALQREQIPDMMEFLETKIEPYATEFEEEIDTALEDLDSALRSQQAQAQNSIDSELNSASDAAGFKRVVDQDVPWILERTSAAFKQECERIMRVLQQQGHSLARSIEDEFASAYQRLAQIEELQLQLHQVRQVDATNISAYASLSGAQDTTARINSSGIVSAWGSALGFGFIGQMFIPIPVFGAIVGGLVGAAISRWLGSAEKKRNEVREALQPAIADYFNSLRRSARKAFQDYIDNIKHVIEEGINQHVNDYEEVITNIREQQDEEQQQLTLLGKMTGTDLAAIKQRQQELERIQQELRNSVVS